MKRKRWAASAALIDVLYWHRFRIRAEVISKERGSKFRRAGLSAASSSSRCTFSNLAFEKLSNSLILHGLFQFMFLFCRYFVSNLKQLLDSTWKQIPAALLLTLQLVSALPTYSRFNRRASFDSEGSFGRRGEEGSGWSGLVRRSTAASPCSLLDLDDAQQREFN